MAKIRIKKNSIESVHEHSNLVPLGISVALNLGLGFMAYKGLSFTVLFELIKNLF